ncbi:MAG: MgtC/SapB family protein [Chlamydiota bacterium]|nr:MgtC/SapB family protein [Chlamydiota bacterium]
MDNIFSHHLNIDFMFRILVSILCGTIVGLERQLNGKPIGIRTSVLIILGTMMFIYLGNEISEEKDATRVLGQVVTGIGFLGAGLIINQQGAVIGVTSAAVVWVLASIGSTIGFGQYTQALIISVICVSVLTGVHTIEKIIVRLAQGIYKGSDNHSSAHNKTEN